MTYDTTIPSFTVDKSLNYVANSMLKEEMSNFNFKSSATTCEITGLNDNAVADIKIPDCVTSIRYDAFYGCKNLTGITIPESVTSIGGSAFSYCSSLTNINVSENNKNYKSINGNLYSKDETILIQYAIGKTANEFTIPDSVTGIGQHAFYGCSSLITITIPNSVTGIGQYAFCGCSSLITITIPNSVTSIGQYAFQRCISLTSIIVSESNLYYLSIDGNLYSKDGKSLIQYAIGKTATTFKIPDSVTSICSAFSFSSCLTSVTIPDSVTSIGSGAFRDCYSLTSIAIPNTVKSIGVFAFWCCGELNSILYNGTIKQWNSITTGENWKDGVSSSCVVYCTEENISISNC